MLTIKPHILISEKWGFKFNSVTGLADLTGVPDAYLVLTLAPARPPACSSNEVLLKRSAP